MSNRLIVHFSAVKYKFIYIYIYDWLTNNDRVKTNIWLVLLNHAISSLRSYRYRLVVTLNTPQTNTAYNEICGIVGPNILCRESWVLKKIQSVNCRSVQFYCRSLVKLKSFGVSDSTKTDGGTAIPYICTERGLETNAPYNHSIPRTAVTGTGISVGPNRTFLTHLLVCVLCVGFSAVNLPEDKKKTNIYSCIPTL